MKHDIHTLPVIPSNISRKLRSTQSICSDPSTTIIFPMWSCPRNSTLIRLPERSNSLISIFRHCPPRISPVTDERLSSTINVIGLSASLSASNEISPSELDIDDVFNVNGGIHWYVVCEN